MRRFGEGRVWALALCAGLSAGAVEAQSREPLCVATELRRLVSAPYVQVNGSDRVAASPLPTAGARGEAFVVAARDPDHSLRVGDARGLARPLAELELSGRAHRYPDRAPGLTVLRVGRDLRVVGDGVFLPDPVRGERGVETYPPGIPVGVTVPGGVLVLEHVAGDLYATVVPPSGPVPPVQRVAEAPAAGESRHRGFVWLTAVARGRGAVALAGTDDGDVVSLVFDQTGARVGEPGHWGQRVGGTMQLVPVPEGADPVATLERPVRGTTLAGEQAREQVLVRLTASLEPRGGPERLGLGPYPTAAVVRNGAVVFTQWAEARGLAVATLPVRDARLQVESPRLWTTSPFEGVPLGHASVLGAGNVIYDLMLHGDDVAGGLHAYLTYLPPAGTPFPRRDVFPLRARVIAPPVLLPADDGVVAVLVDYDELGGGVDAVHVRCDLVTLPPRSSTP